MHLIHESTADMQKLAVRDRGAQRDSHYLPAWVNGRGRRSDTRGRTVQCTMQEINVMRISRVDDECRGPVAVDRERRGRASSSHL